MHWIQIFNITAILFVVSYLWWLNRRVPGPPEWEYMFSKHQLDKALLKISRRYPDKYRFYNFWMQIRRIEMENIPGDFAELGVYKGESARAIHCMAPMRTLHLFDTFTGFEKHDLAGETGEAAAYTENHFADTSVKKVLEFIAGDPEKIKIHAGYFPATAQSLGHLGFAFVSIDADLYQPTKAGLDYFYPRLSPGGIIMVHDFNYKWEGVVKAVNEFTKAHHIHAIRFPDADGTVILVKPGS